MFDVLCGSRFAIASFLGMLFYTFIWLSCVGKMFRLISGYSGHIYFSIYGSSKVSHSKSVILHQRSTHSLNTLFPIKRIGNGFTIHFHWLIPGIHRYGVCIIIAGDAYFPRAPDHTSVFSIFFRNCQMNVYEFMYYVFALMIWHFGYFIVL